MKRIMRRPDNGFTLTEMAIVLVIVGLLIGGMLVPLTAQQDMRANAETTRQLEEIREALIGYAVLKGYLPCPAKSTSDGSEARDLDGSCTDSKRYGLLPWTTLGMKPNDSWNHLFIYSVSPKFSGQISGQKITLDPNVTRTDITIKTRDTAGNLVNLSDVNGIPAVVLSSGKNGHRSWTLYQAEPGADSATANDDEDTNAPPAADGKTFVSRTPSSADAGIGEFDDLVTWLPPYILYNRMIAAGRLP